MFTSIEKEHFATHGLIKKKNVLPLDKVEKARYLLFEHLEQAGLWRNGRWQLEEYAPTVEHDYQLRDVGMRIVKPLNRHQILIDLVNGDPLLAAQELADNQPMTSMSGFPALLFTLPNAKSWSLPYQAWHLDMPRLADGGVPGVQIFTFLDPVEEEGGGTLAVTGSHRLHNEGVRMSSTKLRKKLMRESYFAQLMTNKIDDRQRFLIESGHVGDVELRVVEMTGEVGDVYFMDLRLLHNIAPNARQVPRIMLTERFLLEASRIALKK